MWDLWSTQWHWRREVGHVGIAVDTVSMAEGGVLQMLQLPLANPDYNNCSTTT
jgi:hypothetical protein